MTEILSSIGSIFTSAIGWAGQRRKHLLSLLFRQTDFGGVAKAGSQCVAQRGGVGGVVGETVVGTPLLLLFCAIPLVGLGVGLFKRLLNV